MLQSWTHADGNRGLLEENKTTSPSLDDWEAFMEVPPEIWSTCLGHDASAVPLDGQHHMHDLRVSSKPHCQQGSYWPLHLSFLLKNIENKIQFLSPALHGVLHDFICGLTCYTLLHPFFFLNIFKMGNKECVTDKTKPEVLMYKEKLMLSHFFLAEISFW